MIALLGLIICGTSGVFLSIFAYTRKNKAILYFSFFPVGICLLIELYFFHFIISLLSSGRSSIYGLILLSFVLIPLIFWILFFQKKKSNSGNDVADSYLDDIIEGPDEVE